MSAAASPGGGQVVTHRRYVPRSAAHYGGNLVDGAYLLSLFGDVATELCVRTDGDEGLFAGYEEIAFLAPVLGGDVVEVTATLTGRGRRSRAVLFEARVLCRATPHVGPSAATVLEPPVVVARARGSVVVPEPAGAAHDTPREGPSNG
ncbi:MAG TPA: hotdog fold domain-containing protein [Mycobacteriales bacterium]|nr:hotdog fold domain-containing protein [Mycobacteriales bacterium]